MDEESHIRQRVMNGASVLVHQDIEAFCSRGGEDTVVIGVSLSVSEELKDETMVL